MFHVSVHWWVYRYVSLVSILVDLQIHMKAMYIINTDENLIAGILSNIL